MLSAFFVRADTRAQNQAPKARRQLRSQPSNRYVLHLDPLGAGYKPATLPALYQKMEQQFGAMPGMESVGLALYSTLEGDNWGEAVRVEGRPEPGPNEHTGSSWDRVSATFFQTVGQPVIRGRR